ncbi:MAG TPA: glycosyltransferase [Terriglobia bacterium]|nr:glycosyltransferase [Terriglobia bacterium]
MRILLHGRIYPDSFARNIAVTIERMGHTLCSIEDSPIHRHSNRYWQAFWGLLPRAFPAFERRRHRALVRAAGEFGPDLILLTYGNVPPEVIRELRRSCAAKIAVWFPDPLANFGRQYLLASELDAWFFKDPYLVRLFREKLGINTHYLPEACNPLWHRRLELSPTDRTKYQCDLNTVGNMYYYRAKMLEPFLEYDLKVWGASFPSWLSSPVRRFYPGIYVAEEEKAKAFIAAKIVLNIMFYSEIEGVNWRVFEAAGCGSFQIADWKPALAELFEPEREIVTFRTRNELKEKVDYYLRHPEERAAVADRAYSRAHREHTYEIRLRTMFEILGLGGQDQIPAVEARAEEGH